MGTVSALLGAEQGAGAATCGAPGARPQPPQMAAPDVVDLISDSSDDDDVQIVGASAAATGSRPGSGQGALKRPRKEGQGGEARGEAEGAGGSHRAQGAAQEEGGVDVAPRVLEAPPQNVWLQQLHAERAARQRQRRGAAGSGAATSAAPKAWDGAPAEARVDKLKLLTLNIWFDRACREQRAAALGALVERHDPDVIALQECTAEQVYIMKNETKAGTDGRSWWQRYRSVTDEEYGAAYYTLLLVRRSLEVVPGSARRVPFRNSVMGRDLLSCSIDCGDGERVVIATSHLESPIVYQSPPAWNVEQRQAQLVEALRVLQGWREGEASVAILCGDMNWSEERTRRGAPSDGPMPLPPGWMDAWRTLRPGSDGFTFDTATNKMLTFYGMRERLDRFLLSAGSAWHAQGIEIVGDQCVPGETFVKNVRGKDKVLPVFVSDHYGVLLTLGRTSEAANA